MIHVSDHAWPSPAPPDIHASSRIFVAQQLQRVEPNHDACHGTGLVRGMTWSKTWALGWSGFHGSSINLSVKFKYSTLAIPQIPCCILVSRGCFLDALGRSGKEESQFIKATLICPVLLTMQNLQADRGLLLKMLKDTMTLILCKATDTLRIVQWALNRSVK